MVEDIIRKQDSPSQKFLWVVMITESRKKHVSINFFISFLLARGDVCRLLITLANSLEPT